MTNIASSLRKNLLFQLFILTGLLPGLVFLPVTLQANPSGANVVAGNVNINGLGTGNVSIDQFTNRAIINWQNFSIQQGETTTFNQPNSSAIALNRVVSGNPSQIYGQLSANGGVIVINPNGIVVGPSGQIDVAGLMALSTLDMTDSDFLDGGPMRFRGQSGAGVANYGAITSESGDVVLLGNFLQNAGSVSAPSGTVAFGAGGDIIVDTTASGGVISVLAGGPGGEKGIDNSGQINAAAAELKAHGNVYALAIQNDGLVRASGYNFSGGKLTLSAGRSGSIVNTGNLVARNADGSGGRIDVSGGNVRIASGTVDASGAPGRNGGEVNLTGTSVQVASAASVDASGAVGGTVRIAGESSASVDGGVSVTGSVGNGGQLDVSAASVLVGSNAVVDVSGQAAGGRARFGGGIQGNEADIENSQDTTVEQGSLVIADSSEGDAGQVIFWSDGDTIFRGEVSAQAHGTVGNGGFVEVSGVGSLSYDGTVSTRSANGSTGTLLLDPTDVIIGPGVGTTITDANLVRAVLQNNVVIHTASAGAQVGNITIQSGANVVYDSPNSLAFFAHGSIYVNGDIKNHGVTDVGETGNITLVAGWDGTGAGAFAFDPTNPGAATNGPRVSASDVLGGTYGEWGQNNGSIYLNDAGLEPVEVGSARGETNAFGNDIVMRAGQGNERFTQLGFRRENDLRGVALRNDNGVAASFVGTVSGLASSVTITANNPGGGPIQLISNTATTVDALIAAWNADPANSTNQISLTAGDGTQTVDAYTPVTFSNTTNTARDLDFDTGVTGDINAHAKRDVLLLPGLNASAEEGFKANDRAYVMIGHGGQRDNDNGHENRGGTDFGSDSGHISVGNGNNSGDIVVNAGRAVTLVSNRAEAFTQIGHGGLGQDDPDLGATVNFAESHDFLVADRYISGPEGVGYTGQPGIGQESRRSIWGDMSGDITVTAGTLKMEAGQYNAAFTMIGHGGTRVRGVHSGDITVETTIGGVLVEAAPDSAIGGPANSNDWRWANNRDQSFAQIGHGGFDSDFTDNMILPRRNGVILPTGAGGADVSINNTSVAGDGIRINPDTGEAFGHSGDVSVVSARGIEFRAGNGTDAFAMVGHGGRSTSGDHKGDIKVEAQSGDIIFDRDADQVNERGRDITNRGERAHVQIGHGGTRYQGGSTGDIDVEATGNIEFYAGRSEAYAMIGHGGRGEDASTWNNGRQRNNQANGTHSGDIRVVAGGDIIFRSGFSPRGQAFSQIGHGGYFQQADVMDPGTLTNGALIGGGAASDKDEGHNGDIFVSAGGDISFKAGADTLREGQTYFETNAYDSWTMIGHGGYFAKGDHHGNITVNSVGDLHVEARGGWEAVSIIGADGNDAPRLTSTDDNGRTGFRNFGQIGHGGVDSTHNDNSGDNWNNSGKEGDGIGLDYGSGVSDITLSVGGNLTMLGAMESTAGTMLPDRVLLENGTGDIGAVFNTYVYNYPLFAGSVPGADQVVISADAFNGNGSNDLVLLEGTGGTLAALIADWNLNVTGSEPTVTLRSGDPNQIVAVGDRVAVSAFATYVGRPTGATETFVLRAANLGDDVSITLTGDGATNLQTLVDNWNASNPNNQIIVEAGDATLFNLGNNETVVVANGLDARPQIGPGVSQHHGRLTQVIRNNGEVWDMPDQVMSAEDGYVQIGNGGRSGDYRGGVDGLGHRGNIDVSVGGDITMQAGDIEPQVVTDQVVTISVRNYQGIPAQAGGLVPDGPITGGTIGGLGYHNVGPGIGPDSQQVNFFQNENGNYDRQQMNDQSLGQRQYVQIGLGGWGARGDHLGTITVTGGGNLLLQAGEGREDYAMIGHGGVEADGNNNNDQRAGDTGNRGEVVVDVDGSVRILGGGRDGNVVGVAGTDVTSLSGGINDSRFSFGQIGHGGGETGGNHDGNITVQAGSDIELSAGSSWRWAYAQIGNGGAVARAETNTGEILVVSENGDISLKGGFTAVDSETPTNGLDNTGHISSGRESYAQIGHGGFDADAQGTSQNNNPGDGGFSGDITVIASRGAVSLMGGGDATFTNNNDNFRGMYALIGHGGSYTDGDHTGNIRVAAGSDVTVAGGGASREAFGQIGHGGFDTDGNHGGTIDIDSAGSVILNRGDGLNNPWAKVGHGGQSFGSRANNGAGNREGDITISAGWDFRSTGGSVGHVDSRNDGDLFAYTDGNTFIGVSRNAPFAGGAGNFITDAATVITSSGFGAGSQLRLYLPDSSSNQIAEGTAINSTDYTRTPEPGSNRNDETLALEHTFAVGAFGEPVGNFTPAGDYPTNNFGLYNIYYAGAAPPEPLPPVFLPPVIPPFGFIDYIDLLDLFESSERDEYLLEEDGFGDGLLDGLALEEASDEDDESSNRRRRFNGIKVGSIGLVFYAFEPGTNRYSSYAVFGYPLSGLSVAQ